ncbi:MAG: ABC transporter permease [Terrimicrobiaceae bacterium]|nr:ABC transporter permease [Terrimicrobiaceae bacterium]
MRKFFTLWSREIAVYFRSPAAYVILFFFLLLTGFNFWFVLNAMNRSPSGVSVIEAYFNTVFFWFGFVLPFPLITMRLFAEEYKLGTIEPLMTAPVRDVQVLLAKYLSAVFFYAMLWLPSLLYFVVFQWQTRLQAAPAAGSYLGAYAMLLLIGLFYLAIGCLASALTRNQVVAAIISFAGISLLFYWGFYSRLFPNVSPFLRDLTDYLSPIQHMALFSQGLFDTRPVVLYLSCTALVLFLTFQVFQYRRWKV